MTDMSHSDNNSHTQFHLWAPAGVERAPVPMFSTYRLNDLNHMVIPGDYEGTLDVTIVTTGDVIEGIEVTFHITTDGLIDVEKS